MTMKYILYKEQFTQEDRQTAGDKLVEMLDKNYTIADISRCVMRKYKVSGKQDAERGINQAVLALKARWYNDATAKFACKNTDAGWSLMVLGYLLDRPVEFVGQTIGPAPERDPEPKPVKVFVPTQDDPFSKLERHNEEIIGTLHTLHVDLIKSFRDKVVQHRCTNDQFEAALRVSGVSDRFLEEVFNQA